MKSIILSFLVLVCHLQVSAALKIGYATIVGNADNLNDSDVVNLSIDKYGEPGFQGYRVKYQSYVKNHIFQFFIPVNEEPTKFIMTCSPRKGLLPNKMSNYFKLLITYGLIKSGDSISIVNKGDETIISGKGAKKLNILQHFNIIRNKVFYNFSSTNPMNAKSIFEKQDSLAVLCLSYLEDNKHLIGTDEYDLLKAYALSSYYDKGSFLYWLPDSSKIVALDKLKGYKYDSRSHLADPPSFITHPIIKYSDVFSNSIIKKYIFDSCYSEKKAFNIEKCYYFLVKNYHGVIRERVVINLLYEYRDYKGIDFSDHTKLITNALTYIKDSDFITILNALKNTRSKGAIAYNFSLPDTKGKLHKLSDYRGKIVLMDFWFTGCGNCARIAPDLAKIEKLFEGKPVVFLSISIDRDKEQWLKSVKSGKYSSSLAENLFTNSLGANHPVCRYYSVDSEPTLILVDKQGLLMNNPVSPNIDGGKPLIKQISDEILKE